MYNNKCEIVYMSFSKEIQRRLEVDPILFNDHELRWMINLGFDC